ncbi:MAG: PilZ domain-containing protein [Pyrinomonadaceae bacterium]
MQNENTEHVQRSQPRLAIDLEAIVQAKEADGSSWKEIATVTTISRNGAGFSSPQPCNVGRLVALVLQMPPDLRVYDKKKELYPILGLVQYCNPSRIPEEEGYDIGVAFVGKKPPASHEENPGLHYRITGMAKNGLWNITEAVTAFKPRRFPRYSMSLQVGVSLLQKETRSVVKNTATTRDISIGGASLKCKLDANVGDKVKFACEKLDFYSLAIVRNREDVESDETLLRLEFLDSEFPVDKLHLVKEAKPAPAVIAVGGSYDAETSDEPDAIDDPTDGEFEVEVEVVQF